MKMIRNVISVCIARDIRTWLYVSRSVLRHISAENYIVIVPEIDADLFGLVSPKQYQVISEQDLSPNLGIDRIIAKTPAENRRRAGWYYQQLLKMLAIQKLSSASDDLNLIWDADTLPVQDLAFMYGENRLAYYRSTEHHQPYFDAIDKLIGLKKRVNFSFIAQCFPIYAGWLQEMLDHIEHRHGVSWLEAILTPEILGQVAGFSEYETMGTFIVDRHDPV